MLLEDLDLGIMLRGLPLHEISANKYYPTVENKRPNDDHEVLASNPFPAQVLGCLWHINGNGTPALDFYRLSKPWINVCITIL